MTFSISFVDYTLPSYKVDEQTRLGLICIGDLKEHFIAPLSCWSENDYKVHWRQSLERVVADETTSALIVSMHDPVTANLITWWPMYRIGEIIYFQNHLLFLEKLTAPFDVISPYKSVEERQTITEDGNKISEWEVSVQSIKNFLKGC
jgi:hypothetical protein